jgi:formate dehydrogenase iron-sulfur subunit
LLPDSFSSSYTKPTTRYVTDKEVPESAKSSLRHELHLEEAHWPLAWMLVLTQMAAGLFAASTASAFANHAGASSLLSLVACGVLAIGLTASVMHLGQPLRAWRCFLGWRKSWLSREILAFGGFFKVGIIAWAFNLPTLLAGAALVGVASVYCSAMVYIDTRRPFWKAGVTLPKFFGTTMLLGTSGAAAVLSCMPDAVVMKFTQGFALAATIIRMGLFAFEQRGMRRAAMDPEHDWHRSAKTLMKLKSGALDLRLILVGASTILGVMSLIPVAGLTALWAMLSFLATFASQVLERHLFFVGVTAPRMPGVVPAHPSHRA